MITNKITGTKPFFVHAPGKLEFCPCWTIALQLKPFRIKSTNHNDITVITFNNGYAFDGKQPGSLEDSLRDSQVPFNILGESIINWRNNLKIELLHEFLPSVKTKYVLISDSSDVLLVGDFDSFFQKFSASGIKCCFNAEKMNWPPDMAILPNLNAGLWVAETTFAKELINLAKEANPPTQYKNSEQAYYKIACSELNVMVDINCTFFQGLNRVSPKDLYFFKPF